MIDPFSHHATDGKVMKISAFKNVEYIARTPRATNCRPERIARPSCSRLLPLVSELVDITGKTAAFERLAGRSAMLGFIAAAGAEVVVFGTGTAGVFGEIQSQLSQPAIFLALAVIATSAVLGAIPTQGKGALLLEPVIASLTSRGRSQGSISQRDVDLALDAALESVFSPGFIQTYFPMDLFLEDSSEEENDPLSN